MAVRPEIAEYVERMRVHHARLHGPAPVKSASPDQSPGPGPSATPVAQPGSQATAPHAALPSEANRCVPATTTQSNGSDSPQPKTANTSSVQLPGGPVQPSQDALETNAKLLADSLIGARGYVGGRINNYFDAYAHSASELAKTYDEAAKKEKEMQDAVVQIALTLPFFFAGGLITMAVGRLATQAEQIIATDSSAALAAFKAGVDKAAPGATEVLKKTLDKMSDGLSKSIAGSTSKSVTMLRYLNLYVESLLDSKTELYDSLTGIHDIYGLAAIMAALEIRSPKAFDRDFKVHIAKFEKEVAPTMAPEHITDLDGGGGSTKEICVMVKVRANTGIYQAQVRKTTIEGGFSAAERFDFVTWVDVQDQGNIVGAGQPIEMKPEAISGLPLGAPPQTSLLS